MEAKPVRSKQCFLNHLCHKEVPHEFIMCHYMYDCTGTDRKKR